MIMKRINRIPVIALASTLLLLTACDINSDLILQADRKWELRQAVLYNPTTIATLKPFIARVKEGLRIPTSVNIEVLGVMVEVFNFDTFNPIAPLTETASEHIQKYLATQGYTVTVTWNKISEKEIELNATIKGQGYDKLSAFFDNVGNNTAGIASLGLNHFRVREGTAGMLTIGVDYVGNGGLPLELVYTRNIRIHGQSISQVSAGGAISASLLVNGGQMALWSNPPSGHLEMTVQPKSEGILGGQVSGTTILIGLGGTGIIGLLGVGVVLLRRRKPSYSRSSGDDDFDFPDMFSRTDE